MGIVSGAVLEGGGEVTGVVPIAMVAAGGEGDKGEEKVEPYSQDVNVALNEKGREKVGALSDRFMSYLRPIGRSKLCV